MARIDTYLKAIAGEDITPAAPVSRLDKSLAVMAGGEGDLPPAVSSLDKNLNAAVEALQKDEGGEK